MCGIAAYTGLTVPDPDLITAAARMAARRGPHAHGWTGHGLEPVLRLGPMDPAELAKVGTPRLVAHARLATYASHDDYTAIQPISFGGHALAYNGTTTNLHDLTTTPPAGGDAWALAAAYSFHRDAGLTPPDALKTIAAAANHRAWVLTVLDADGTLTAHRHHLPLFRLATSHGIYLASGRFHPDCELIAPDHVIQEPPW